MVKLFCSPREQLAGETWVKSKDREGGLWSNHRTKLRLNQVAQGFLHPGLENILGWRSHNHPEQLAPVFN